MAQYHESSLNKSTFDLRDKSIVKLDREKVDGLDTAFDDKSVALSKSGSDWKITRPLATRADGSAVEGVLGRLEGAQMKSIATESATAAKSWLLIPNSGQSELMPPNGSSTPWIRK